MPQGHSEFADLVVTIFSDMVLKLQCPGITPALHYGGRYGVNSTRHHDQLPTFSGITAPRTLNV